MATSTDSLICPITHELFRNPVVAQDGHTYEREAIESWIRKCGTSPITDQQLSLEHLHPNHIIKQLVGVSEKSLDQKNYQFILDVDVKKKKGRPLFQTFGKTIYHAEWLPTNSNQPEIIILKIDGARALKEASFYVNLTRHPHVVRTFGFVLDKKNDEGNNSIMLLQESAPEGSLYELLQERSTTPDEKTLIEMFLQIIDAMVFLAYNHVVHGDLACRNVLVFRFDETNSKNNIVKVTDFGLSRQSKLYSTTGGSAKTTLDIVPTRYAAPEILVGSLIPDNYTEKSDVYSMGVLMWEAYSRGALPWSKVEKDAEVIGNVMNGVLLPQPSKCSSKYWNIITKTWSNLPQDRPTFEQLKRLLIEQIYLPGINSSDEQRTTEPNSEPVKVEGANKLLASRLSSSNEATTRSTPSAGKTALVKRYVHNSYSEHGRATIGVDFGSKILKYNDETTIDLQLWDIAGQERFGNITRAYFRGAVGCFIVFDVTRGSTFEAVTKWKTDLDNKVQLPDGNPIPCVLLANKCDLAKEGLLNNAQQMDEFCKEKGFAMWFGTSVKENINIEASARFLIREIMEHIERIQPRPSGGQSRSGTLTVHDKQDPAAKPGGNCCGGESSNGESGASKS